MLKYIELDGKKPKHTFNEFSTTPEHYQDAAILLNSKIVVVDFDQFTDIGEIIYKKYPTLKVKTSRGFHLYYKRPKVPMKNWTHKLTNVGVTVDYKTGSRAVAVVKQNGQMRPMEHGELLGDFDRLPDLPFELYPSKLSQLLYGMADGDGRNSALYTHLLAVREMYGSDQDTITYISSFINQYVFKDPMKDQELKRLIESVNSKQLQDTKYLNPKDMVMTSEVLVKRLDIKYYQQKLYFKKGDRYIHDPKNNLLLREIDRYISLKPSQHKELLNLFEIKSELVTGNDFPIQLRDGYVLEDGEVFQLNVGFTPYYLNVKYDKSAYDEHVDQFLDFLTMGRDDLRRVIEEMFGHMLMTRGFPHKVFFLQGASGENGKSTLIKMIKNFMGDLTALLPLQKFDDDTSVYSLVGMLANIGDDIDASFLEKSSNFKTLASGDPIMVRPIYTAPVKVENKATLIFTCNEMPTFKDKTGGIARRIVVIPCDNKVKKRDIDIDQKLSTDNAKSYLLNLAIAGIQRILKQGGLSYSETIERLTQEYMAETDSVLSFLMDNEVEGKSVDTVYMQYTIYCEEVGLKPVSKISMGKRLNAAGYKTKQSKINGKNRRVYEKVG